MTYQDLIAFANAAEAWLQGKLEGGKPQPSKLTYATEKLLKRAKPLLDAYQEKLEDINIQHAAEKDGVIVREANGQTAFSKADLQKRNAAIRALVRSEVKIEPYLVQVVPAGLAYGLQAALTGFVLPVIDDQEPAE